MDSPKPSPQHIDAGQPQPTPATVSDAQGRNEHQPGCGKWAQTVLHGRQLMGDLPCTCNRSALSQPQDAIESVIAEMVGVTEDPHRETPIDVEQVRRWTRRLYLALAVPVAQTPQEPSQESK